MPNDNAKICDCVELRTIQSKSSRNGITIIKTRNATDPIMIIARANPTALLTKNGGSNNALNNGRTSQNNGSSAAANKNKYQQQQQQLSGEHQEANNARSRGGQGRLTGLESSGGTTSAVIIGTPDHHYQSSRAHRSKKKKRLHSARRARSAERPDSHYTYIDSGSSVVSRDSANSREDSLVSSEALYCSIDEQLDRMSIIERNNESCSGSAIINESQQQQQQQQQNQNRPQQQQSPIVPPIPSMTSPPPTYDVAISKNWQNGQPPSYDYLCHSDPLFRSHTPPPPWTESINSAVMSGQCTPEQANQYYQLLRDSAVHQATLRKLQAQRAAQQQQQRSRPQPVRSASETRAQQMSQEAAFCMETTALQSAFDNAMPMCSIQ